MKIAVAIDESPCSEAAFDALMARIWKPDTEVLVVTVIQPMTSEFAVSAAFAVGPLLEKVAKNSECSVEIVRHTAPQKLPAIDKEVRSASPLSEWQNEAVC